jgi:hypothetical protein
VTIFLYEFNPGMHSGLIVVLKELYIECGKEGEMPDLGYSHGFFSAGFVKSTKIPNTVARFGDEI